MRPTRRRHRPREEAATNDLRIRDATDDDAEDIAVLLGQLGYPAPATAIPARLARMRSEPGQTALVAVDGDGGPVVGLATIVIRHVIDADAPFARLAALVVAEASRGAGVGRALVERVEQLARDAGCASMEVTSGLHRPAAHGFYRALGFTERPRRFWKRL